MLKIGHEVVRPGVRLGDPTYTIPVPEVLAAEMWQGHPVLVLS